MHHGQTRLTQSQRLSAHLRRPNNSIFVLITPFCESLWTLENGCLPFEKAAPRPLAAGGMIVGRLDALAFWPITCLDRYGEKEDLSRPVCLLLESAYHKWLSSFWRTFDHSYRVPPLSSSFIVRTSLQFNHEVWAQNFCKFQFHLLHSSSTSYMFRTRPTCTMNGGHFTLTITGWSANSR
jgi:hypothetical protein